MPGATEELLNTHEGGRRSRLFLILVMALFLAGLVVWGSLYAIYNHRIADCCEKKRGELENEMGVVSCATSKPLKKSCTELHDYVLYSMYAIIGLAGVLILFAYIKLETFEFVTLVVSIGLTAAAVFIGINFAIVSGATECFPKKFRFGHDFPKHNHECIHLSTEEKFKHGMKNVFKNKGDPAHLALAFLSSALVMVAIFCVLIFYHACCATHSQRQRIRRVITFMKRGHAYDTLPQDSEDTPPPPYTLQKQLDTEENAAHEHIEMQPMNPASAHQPEPLLVSKEEGRKPAEDGESESESDTDSSSETGPGHEASSMLTPIRFFGISTENTLTHSGTDLEEEGDRIREKKDE
jgi:hypothetical protein